MHKRILIPTLLLMALAFEARSATWYVATNGNDSWSGTKASPNRAGTDGPFATVAAALKGARAGKEPKNIFVRSGLYPLAEPLRFTPEDSGSDAKHPTVIAPYRSEKPILSGGRIIRGWHRAANNSNLWQTEIAAVREGKWYFRQLFINGERRQRARTPNEGTFRIQGSSPGKPAKIKFKPGEIKKEWAADGDVEAVAYVAWTNIRMQIRDVDEEKRVATLSGDFRTDINENNAQYFIENTIDALDVPGEWYLDRKSGVLSYWPKPGEEMSRVEAIAPELEELITFKGDISRPVHNLALRGLTFSHTDWTLGTNGYADNQAANTTRGDILAESASDCLIEDCTFSHLGGYGLELGRGCKNIRVIGNEIFDLGAGGIRIGETRPNSSEQNYGQVITDNHLHHLGEVYPPAVGVLILQSGTNRVAHNDIHDLYYTAVSVGWTWGYRDSPCRANVIEFNHMHDIGKGLLSDMGGVYTLGPQPGTVVRNNLIHDVNAFTYGGWGLYTDEGSTGIVLENNVVYRCKSAGFHQHYGKENTLRNNIFAFGKEHQLMRTRPEPHSSFTFTNNIVYFDSGDLLGSDWSNEHYTIDSNVYYDARLQSAPESLKLNGISLAKWRERGHDQHSVLADPQFAAPQKYDFSLRSGSPALKLGFKPIDLSEVGIRKKSKRK
jgi:parallel beta-helix repeat protein